MTRQDPEWLRWDAALLAALDDYEGTLCACGEPWESHAGKTSADYASAYLTCPAMQAEEAEQAKRLRAEGHEHAKADPARSRFWITKTVDSMRLWARAMGGGDG